MISQVPDDSQGKAARCPKCGLLIKIPVLSAARPVPPAQAASSPAPPPRVQSVKSLEAATVLSSQPAVSAADAEPFGFALEARGARPRQRKTTSSNLPWIAVAVGGGFLLVIGVVLAAFTGGPKPPEVSQVAGNNPKDTTYYPKQETALPSEKAVPAGVRGD